LLIAFIVSGYCANIKYSVEKSGLSQQELADYAGVSKITIQRIENAKYSVMLDIIILISDELQIPLKKLVDY
jgi:transcriptional regulator with XRE-family HTH domain